MLDLLLLATGALGLTLAAVSRQIRRMPVSEALVALVVGVLLGPSVLGLLDLAPITETAPEFHRATEVLLALSVMAVALRYPFGAVRRVAAPTALLVLVGLVGMAALTTGVAAAVLGAGASAALLLAVALSPTDPVLASSAVTGDVAEDVLPDRDRQLLSLESGANDGLALPLVLVAVGLADTAAGLRVGEAAVKVLGGVLVGLVLGAAAGHVLRLSEEHDEAEHAPMLLYTLLLAVGVLGLCALAGLNGVLASFAAGLAFNATSTSSERGLEAPIDDAVNRILVLPLFIALGAALPWSAWAELGWQGVGLALLVLLLRRPPVLLLLRRPLRLSWPEDAYVGWFGPIGVSALFYLTLEEEHGVIGPELLAAGTLVVVASTLVHGMTTAPGLAAYRRAAR